MKNVVVTGCPRADADQERASRAVFRRGNWAWTGMGLRSVLTELGVEYVDYHRYREAGP